MTNNAINAKMPFKILYTADLHGNENFYNKLFEKGRDNDINAVVIGGDLCPRGGSSLESSIEVQKSFLENFLIPKIEEFGKDVFLIMGNDDFRVNYKILEDAEEKGILKIMHKKMHKLGSKSIVGYSFVNPTPFRLRDWEKFEDENNEEPNRFSDEIIRSMEEEKGTIKEDMEKLKRLSNPGSTVYVMHAPPFNTKLDITAAKQHVGSKAIRSFIEKEQPFLALHGHIHESPRMSGSFADKIGKTACINVGSSYPKDLLNCIIIEIHTLNLKYLEI